jgi:hypothetical protein
VGTSRAITTLQASVIGLVAGFLTDLVWQQQGAGWVSILAPIAMALSARLLADAVTDRLSLATLAVALGTYWFGVLLFPIALAISGALSADLVRSLVTLYAWTPAGLAFALPTVPAVVSAAAVHVLLVRRRVAAEEPADPDRNRRFRLRTVALTVVTVLGIGVGAAMLNDAAAATSSAAAVAAVLPA